MAEPSEVRIPHLGADEPVEVVEVLVAPGDQVSREDSLITLESDKASMDVPSPADGKVLELKVKRGDKVKEGSLILLLEAAGEPLVEPEKAGVSPKPGQETTQETPQEPAQKPADPRQEATAKVGPPPVAPPAVKVESRAFDAPLVVIGAGVGGYTAAFRAADLGLAVTLVERYPTLGGVCLNVGCIPSKALLHVADVIHEAEALDARGVSFGAPVIDLGRLRAWKDEVVGRLTGGISELAKRRKVKVLQGRARFLGEHELEVASDDGVETLSFGQAIIAAGSRVVKIPGVPYDDPRVMDSTDALELPDVPENLLLVGGGIIGLEMAMVFGALGTKLTIVELLDGLIPECDRDLVRPLEARLKKGMGAEIHLGTKMTSLESLADGSGLVAQLEGSGGSKSATFDRALIAVGRRPNGDLLNAGAAGVEVDERGFIAVDRSLRTNQQHIYAIGDIVGEPMLAHKASHQGKVAAENAAGENSAFDARVIPLVAYTDPEIAWVGLTETDAKANGTVFEKVKFPWAASGRALGMGRTDGSTKLLFDPETKRLLGGGIVGLGAGDLISEVALAIEMDCEAADLALTIHPHPTVSETIGFAAEVFEGTITDLFRPKR